MNEETKPFHPGDKVTFMTTRCTVGGSCRFSTREATFVDATSPHYGIVRLRNGRRLTIALSELRHHDQQSAVMDIFQQLSVPLSK